MNRTRKLLLVAAIGFAALAPLSNAHAQQITVAIGDRPYYTHGSAYWHNGARYVWVPGHRGRYGWVRGHYVVRDRRYYRSPRRVWQGW